MSGNFEGIKKQKFGVEIENFFLSQIIPKGFDEDEKVRQKVVDYFSSFDPSIIDFKVEVIKSDIYILSEMHVGSMRTSRLPLTTLYADKICKQHDHVPHDTLSNRLFFL